MFDIGGVELLVVAVVAIIVVGPKDLPGMLRRAGRVVAKVRGMASEFKTHFDEVADQEEFKEIRKSLESVKDLSPTNQIKDVLEPFKEAGDSIKETMDNADKTPEQKAPATAETDTDPTTETKTAAKPKKTPRKAAKKATPKKSAAKKTTAKKTAAKKTTTNKKTATRKPRKSAEKAGA